MNGVYGLAIALCAFGVSWALAGAVRRHAVALNLVQSPNERSSHVVPTPSGGGVGIAIAGTVAGVFVCINASAYFWWVLVTSALIACVGLVDDRFDLSSRVRIVVHFLVVGILLFFLPPLPAMVTPLGELPGPILYTVALIAGVWWINLFNFMDGIDGIAASQAVFMAVAVAALVVVTGGAIQPDPAIFWLFFTVSATAGFLVLNWPPAKVFMGDAGSNYLSVIILALGLYEVAVGRLSYAAFLILIAAFLSDATITLVRRAVSGERWFAAHRLHAYQKLSRKWRSHRAVTVLYLAINLLWLYPLAYFAAVFPQHNLLAVGAAYVPIASLCIWAGAGVPETTVSKT